MNITRLTRRALMGLSFAAALFGAGSVAALSTSDAETFVTTVMGELRALVENDKRGAEGAAEFLEVLRKRTALEAVGKFAMGRTWREMNDGQQSAYMEAFRSYISQTYQKRFDNYHGESVEVTGSVDAGKKGILVKSLLHRPSGSPVALEWVVTDRTGSTLLSDVIFEGVSLAVTLRENFGGMLEKNGGDIDAFIKELAASSV